MNTATELLPELGKPFTDEIDRAVAWAVPDVEEESPKLFGM